MEYSRRTTCILSRLTLMVAMIAAAFTVSAQSVVLSPSISADKVTPVVSGVLNALQGSGSMSYDITLSTDVSSVSEAYYMLNGTRHELNYTVSNNRVTFLNRPTISFDEPGDTEPITVSVSFAPLNGGEEVTQTATAEYGVKVWPSATATIETDIPSWGILSGEYFTVTANAHGGYDQGWRYTWGAGQNTHSVRAENLTTDVRTVTYTYSATNYAPDGRSVWESIVRSFEVTVYPHPHTQEGTTYPTVAFAGTRVRAIVLYRSGNPNGWTFNWTGTDDPENHGSEAIYTAVNNGTSSIIHPITVNAINNSPDGTQWNNSQYTYNVTVWPAPSVTLQAPDRTEWINGETMNLTAVPAGGDSNRWTYSWTVDGTPTTGNGNTLSYVAVNNGNAPATHTISVTATNAPHNISEPFSVTRSYTFTVYPTPTVSDYTIDKPVSFSGSAVTMSATAAGGNPETWSYRWLLDGSPIDGSNSTLTTTPPVNNTSSVASHVYTIVANNTCGDQITTINHDFVISVWPAPSAELASLHDRLFNGDVESLSVTTTGGSESAWTYSWSVDGNSVGNTSSYYSYTAVNTTSQAVTHTVTVTATNTPDGIDRPYTVTLTRSFIVYPDPAGNIEVNRPVVFTETTVNPTFTPTGGNPDGWTYEWKLNGSPVEGAGASISYTPINNGTTAQTLTFEVTATNTIVYENEHVADNIKRVTRTVDVTVWPAASSSFSSSTRTQLINGESLILGAAVKGGDPANWTYLWQMDGQALPETNHSYVYEAVNTGNAPATHIVTLTVTNAPAGIDRPYTTTYSYTCTVYPSPELIGELHNPITFSGTPVTINAEARGGNPAGWAYSWTLDGNTIAGTEPTLTTTPPVNTTSAAQTHTYRITAVNTCETTVNTLTYDFDVTVWPAPSATLTMPKRTEWLNGQQFTLTTVPTGGDSNAWSYVWTLDGNAFSSNTASIDYTTVNNGTAGAAHTLTVKATNAPAGINAPYTYEQSYTWNVYPDPALNGATINKDVIFSGTPVTMSVNAIGGYPSNWKFSWSLDGSTISGNESSLTVTPPINTSSAARSHTYRVTAVNTCDEQVTTLTHDFNVTIWPAPSATLSGQLPDEVISGDNMRMTVTPVGGDSNNWQYKWSVNDVEMQEGTSPVYNFRAINENENEPLTAEVKVEITNTPAGIDAPFTATYTHKVVIWPGPTAISIINNNPVTCDKRTLTLGVRYVGGQSSNWAFSWTRNGRPIDNTLPTLPVTFSNTSNSMITEVYTVTSTNSIGNEVRYTYTETYTVSVYPNMSVTTNQTYDDIYYQGTNTLTVGTRGGYPDGWTFEWTDGLGAEASTVFTAPVNNNADSYAKNVKVTVTNGYGDEIWYRETLNFDFNCWSRGEVTPATILDEYYNGNINTTLQTNVKGGYSDGWTYVWYLNGTAQADAQPSLAINETNYGDNEQYYSWTLVATNTLNGITGCSTTIPFNFYLCPIIETPTAFAVSSQSVRNGSTIVLSVTPSEATGGSSLGWHYNWTADGSSIGSNSPVISQVINLPASNSMSYTDIVYGLRLYTVNPNSLSSYWFDETYPTRTVRVYNMPVVPRELTRKGNGTTCTMIALIDVTDAQLAERNYSFVFGYTDAQGVDHAMPATEDRYYRFTSDVFNNASNNFWVYTRWAYGDGVTVTSNRRYLDGHTDNFDGSTFDTSGRGDSAGLDEITVGDDDIYIDSRGFKANLTSAGEATVRIYNAAGNAVYVNRYPEADAFTETFDKASLAPGIYIVHVNAGYNVKVKKIVIK